MDTDLREILFALNAHNVEYLVVGGYAVSTYSEPRGAKDLDVPRQIECREQSKSLSGPCGIRRSAVGNNARRLQQSPDNGLSNKYSALRIDILQRITGVDFDEAWDACVEGSIDGIPTHVISKEHLIQNKLAVGRRQDLLDVENIREADSLV